MHIMVVGQAKSGTTALYSAILESLSGRVFTLFEPRSTEQMETVLSATGYEHTLTEVLLGEAVKSRFDFTLPDKIVSTSRDPRDNVSNSSRREWIAGALDQFDVGGSDSGLLKNGCLYCRLALTRDLLKPPYRCAGWSQTPLERQWLRLRPQRCFSSAISLPLDWTGPDVNALGR